VSKIIFLGTAGDGAAVSRQLRASGGIILQLENMQFHLDPGPGSLQQANLLGINTHHTTAVLVSHNHVNHCNDLNVIIDAMTHGGIEQRGLVLGSKSTLQQSDNNFPYLTKHHRSLVEKVIPMGKKHKVGIELVEINSIPAQHHDDSAIGFKFFCPKFTLSYTGDTILTKELLEALAGTDILVLNVPYLQNGEKHFNLDVPQAIKIVSQVRPQLAILTHFGMEMLKADPLQSAREIQRITGVQVIAAKDGLIITPEGYGRYQGPVKGY
jgi:ribonuclease BN (tRNA processing enzyme)